jgi:SOS-response transcriptional repressor LexA
MPENKPKMFEPTEFISLDEFIGREPSGDLCYVAVSGDEASDLGIKDGDLLVVDRDRVPETGNLVIAQVKADLIIMVFRYRQRSKGVHFATIENQEVLKSNHKSVFVEQTQDYLVWATITHILRNAVKNGGFCNA